MISEKIKDRPELVELVRDLKGSGKKIGFTNGCFDILHVGHVRYLNEARRSCDILVLGLNSDSSVRALKGKGRPVNEELARAEVLSALSCVDLITIFSEETPEELVTSLTPDILFKGGDWDRDKVVGGKHVVEHGGRVEIIRFVEGYSTTGTIEKMGKADNSCR